MTKKITSLLLSGIMLSCFCTQAVAKNTVTINKVTFPARLLDILKFIPEDSKTGVKPDVGVLLKGPFIDFLRALKSTNKFKQNILHALAAENERADDLEYLLKLLSPKYDTENYSRDSLGISYSEFENTEIVQTVISGDMDLFPRKLRELYYKPAIEVLGIIYGRTNTGQTFDDLIVERLSGDHGMEFYESPFYDKIINRMGFRRPTAPDIVYSREKRTIRRTVDNRLDLRRDIHKTKDNEGLRPIDLAKRLGNDQTHRVLKDNLHRIFVKGAGINLVLSFLLGGVPSAWAVHELIESEPLSKPSMLIGFVFGSMAALNAIDLCRAKFGNTPSKQDAVSSP